MQSKEMLKLFAKLLAFSLPVLLLLLSYLVYDPFRVLYAYPNYERNCFVALDRDFVGAEVYMHQRAQQHYNAFIFGNSRSLSFLCKDWKPYIGNAAPFHYDASGENLKALRDKVLFIDAEHGRLDHALLVLDDLVLGNTTAIAGPFSQPHPRVSKTSWISFHLTLFTSYLSEFYFVKYLEYYYTHKYRPYMKGVVETRPIDYDSISNDFYLKVYDEQLEHDPQSYIQAHLEYYTPRDTNTVTFTNSVIGDEQLKMLKEIKAVFDKQHTDYKIVLSPAYDMKYFNRKDLALLYAVFGRDKVFDFSGKNEYTRDIRNYYESIHYRPKVARDILKKIYAK